VNMCAYMDNILDKSVREDNFVCELFYGSYVCIGRNVTGVFNYDFDLWGSFDSIYE